MTKTAKKPKTGNTLDAAHAEAEAWRRSLLWMTRANELQTWGLVLPLLGKILADDKFATMREAMMGSADLFVALHGHCARLSRVAAEEAHRIRTARGVPIPSERNEP